MICVANKAGFIFWTSLGRNADTAPHLQFLISPTFNESERIYRFKHYNKVFLSREPSERLWSTYNDKFVYPLMTYRIAYSMRIRERNNATGNNVSLCDDVTFSQFLNSIVQELKFETPNANQHWETYNRICRPCDVDYTFVGKMEHFKSDFDVVKKMLGIHHLREPSTPTWRLKKLFDIFVPPEKNIPPCMTSIYYAELLWKTIQGTGNIDLNEALPKVFKLLYSFSFLLK